MEEGLLSIQIVKIQINFSANYFFFNYLFCVDGDCLMATWASSDKALSGELGLMRIP